jgi:tetratricopeptide (TPR) repeat protein
LWHDAGNIDKELEHMRGFVDRLVKYIGDYDRANELAEYALSILPDGDVRCVDYLNPLSRMNWHRGQYEQAELYATHANTLSKYHNYNLGLADSYNSLGNTAYYLGHYQASIIYYRQCQELHHELGNQWDWAFNLHNMGWVFPFVGDYESAWDYVEQGQSIFIELDDIWGIANGYYIMALIASHQGNFVDALEFHLKSLDLYGKFDAPWNHALNLANLGFVYLELNEIDKAQSTFYDCMRMCYSAKLNGSLLESLVGIARLFIHYKSEKRAAILLGMIQAHPAMNSDVQMRLKPLQQLLESTMPKADLQKAIQQGSTMDIEDIVSKMLVQTL